MRPLAILALPLVSLSACATLQPAACTDEAVSRLVAELVFGRNIGDRVGVSRADWRRFLDEEVTPRFPGGFTVLDGSGQWRDGEGARIVREPSKVLVIALADEAAGRTRVAEIAEAYKRRFRQRSVLTITRPGCVSF